MQALEECGCAGFGLFNYVYVHFAHEMSDFEELYMQLKQFEKLCKKGVDFCRDGW